MKFVKLVVGTAFVLFCGLIIFEMGKMDCKPGSYAVLPSSSSDGPPSSDVPPPSAITISALALADKYHANEISADQEYKGRQLIVAGYVESINKDFTDAPYLILGSGNEFMGVNAELRREDEGAAANLAKGQPVRLSCTGSGMVIGSPMLKDCSFLPLDQSPAAEGPTQNASTAEPASPVLTQDGRGVATDPTSVSAVDDDKAEAEEAMKNSPDVWSKVLGPGQAMVMMPYGPCGTVSKSDAGIIWATNAGHETFPDTNSAVKTAYAQCEELYQVTKHQRERAGATN